MPRTSRTRADKNKTEKQSLDEKKNFVEDSEESDSTLTDASIIDATECIKETKMEGIEPTNGGTDITPVGPVLDSDDGGEADVEDNDNKEVEKKEESPTADDYLTGILSAFPRIGLPIVVDPSTLPKWLEMRVMNSDTKYPGPLDPVPIQNLVEWAYYDRIAKFERTKGEDYTLENLALITDTSDYHLSNGLVRRDGRSTAVRFFIVGVMTAEANLRGDARSLPKGRRNLYVKPSMYSWGRASSVMGRILGTQKCFAYMFYGGLTFSTLSDGTSDAVPRRRIPSSKKKEISPLSNEMDIVDWPNPEKLPAGTKVPIRDGRYNEFDPKEFRRLRNYPFQDNLKEGNVVMAVFTMGTYEKDTKVHLSLNIQEVVLLHGEEQVLGEEEVMDVDGLTPLPFKEL